MKEEPRDLPPVACTALLGELIEAMISVYGPDDWEYFKSYHMYRKGKHWSRCGGDEQVTREEYEKHEAESRASWSAAFRGNLKQDYTEYYRRMKKGGWRDRLIELVKTHGDTPNPNFQAGGTL